MKRFSLVYALLLMGFTAIIGQVILIRELLVSFYGNELSIGIFFANWLLLEAVGSYAAGRLADKVKSGTSYYAFLQVIISLTLPAIIFLTRIVKNLLGIIPGQGINMFTIFYISFFLLAPLGLADGAQFSFGCRIFTEGDKKKVSSIGKVYVYEAIGSLLGGIVATYICIQYLNSFQTAFALAILNFSSAILLLIYGKSNSKQKSQYKKFQLHFGKYGLLKIATPLLLILCLVGFMLGGFDYLQNQSIKGQWRNYEVIDDRNSIYGNVVLLKRFEQINIMSNGVPISTIPTPDVAFIEEFVHLPLLFHNSPQHILLIGGGIGGVLQEILKHPIQKLDYTELDPLIIQTAKQYTSSLTEMELNDPRVKVHNVDGRYYIRTTDKTYDTILINLPDPSTLEINRLYTLEFYRMIKKRLKEQGILAFHFPGNLIYLSNEMINLNANLIYTVKNVFPYITIIPGDFNLLLASNDHHLTKISPDSLIQRMLERSLQTQLLSDFHIRYKLDEMRQEWYKNEISKAEHISINQDSHPSALYYDLAFWNSVHSPGFAKIYNPLKRLKLSYIITIIIIIFALIFYLQRNIPRWKKSFIVLPIITTGFVGMGVDIMLVLAFQSFYGYIYHWIGLLISAFMVGLTFGGMWTTQRVKQVSNHDQKLILDSNKRNSTDNSFLFLLLELFIFLFIMLFIGMLLITSHFHESHFVFFTNKFLLLILNILCGFLVGAEFPLANKIYLESTSQITKTAGALYAADLVGAWIGALFITIAFIPVLGIMNTCLILLIIKMGSLLLFYTQCY